MFKNYLLSITEATGRGRHYVRAEISLRKLIGIFLLFLVGLGVLSRLGLSQSHMRPSSNGSSNNAKVSSLEPTEMPSLPTCTSVVLSIRETLQTWELVANMKDGLAEAYVFRSVQKNGDAVYIQWVLTPIKAEAEMATDRGWTLQEDMTCEKNGQPLKALWKITKRKEKA